VEVFDPASTRVLLVSYLANSSILKMEAIYSSKIWGSFPTTRRHSQKTVLSLYFLFCCSQIPEAHLSLKATSTSLLSVHFYLLY
jgi:hypothetical protein